MMREMRAMISIMLMISLLVSCASSATYPASEINSKTYQQQQETDFSTPGPCDVDTDYDAFSVPDPLASRLASSLSVTYTLPNCTSVPDYPTPRPVLFFYSGFQLRAGYYAKITERAATHGYVVVQYDLPLLSIKPAILEVDLFPYFYTWVDAESKRPGSALNTAHADLGTAAFIAGHSRGGKLASLIYASNLDSLQTAYLIDPIDASSMAPISRDNPSGVEALDAVHKPIAVVGAGKLSYCNPTQGNYQKFFAVGAKGSWMVEIPGASHSTFEDGGPVINVVQDLACGRGPAGRDTVAELTSTPMLAWFYEQQQEQQRRPHGALVVDPLSAFFDWIQAEEDQGLLVFDEKKTDTGISIGTGIGTLTGRLRRHKENNLVVNVL